VEKNLDVVYALSFCAVAIPFVKGAWLTPFHLKNSNKNPKLQNNNYTDFGAKITQITTDFALLERSSKIF
jgi:hypothetical protein